MNINCYYAHHEHHSTQLQPVSVIQKRCFDRFLDRTCMCKHAYLHLLIKALNDETKSFIVTWPIVFCTLHADNQVAVLARPSEYHSPLTVAWFQGGASSFTCHTRHLAIVMHCSFACRIDEQKTPMQYIARLEDTFQSSLASSSPLLLVPSSANHSSILNQNGFHHIHLSLYLRPWSRAANRPWDRREGLRVVLCGRINCEYSFHLPSFLLDTVTCKIIVTHSPKRLMPL
jgi:hypothetical protein